MTLSQTPFIKILGLVFLAALISTLCDANHVYTGALSYSSPAFLNQAWWVFPNFLLAFTVMSVFYSLFSYVFPRILQDHFSFQAGTAAAFLDNTVFFVLCYLLSGFAHAYPNLLSLILYLSFGLRLTVTYERGFLFTMAVLMAFGGHVVEGSLAALGQMQYSEPQIYHVPYWLGALYMNGAFCLRESFRFFVYSAKP